MGFDAKKAFANGLVKSVTLDGKQWMLIAIVGTEGSNDHSHWRGKVVCQGSEKEVIEETMRETMRQIGRASCRERV